MERKVIVITGCSTGLGKNLCNVLTEKGYKVVATARDVRKLEDVLANMKLELDVSNDTSIKNAVDKIIKQYGKIDILVNNAGYSVRAAVEEIDLEEMSKMVDTVPQNMQ